MATNKGETSHIDIYLRIKPGPKPSTRVALDANESKVDFNIPRDVAAGLINNQREQYKFQFNGVLTPEAKQDEVFERVARNVVMGAMEGYNGTIFAYGQTGSGKTFTITGGPERYVDRGIIPRSISAIFEAISKRSDGYQYTVHISYLEIYNENGYDLLDPNREVKAMEDLAQVHVMEGDEGTVNYRNLSLFRANNEEEALNLLFLGDTNRTISETPMNMASSRSHCVFTVFIEARKKGEDIVRHSKLNLVDLAGSERVSKTGVDGMTLKEAKYINLSLHYLEQVIIALQERAMGMARPHIPYRNSMMTMALKDSLGGNCRTVMVATMSQANDQLDESISTCRFAQRVAMVSNKVLVNEDLDPALVIRRLKQEVRDMREELRALKGEDAERGPLTPDEVERLKGQVEAYVADSDPDAALNLGGSMIFIRAAFEVFKRLLRTGGGGFPRSGVGGGAAGGKDGGGTGGPDTVGDADQIRKLKLQVQQRDNEINILVSMLKRREGGKGGPGLSMAASTTASGSFLPSGNGSAATGHGLDTHLNAAASGDLGSPGMGNQMAGRNGGMQMSPAGAAGAAAMVREGSVSLDAYGGATGGGDDVSVLMNTELLADRHKAFDLFRRSYKQNEVMEENKALLKEKYTTVKGLAETVGRCKTKIQELKALIEQRRLMRSMQGGDLTQEDAEEERCKVEIEQVKEQYKSAFDELRERKKDVDRLHQLLEHSRTRTQRDFEQWMGLMTRQAQAAEAAVAGARPAQAWASPPAQNGSVPHQQQQQQQQQYGSPHQMRPPSASSSHAIGRSSSSNGRGSSTPPPAVSQAGQQGSSRQAWGSDSPTSSSSYAATAFSPGNSSSSTGQAGSFTSPSGRPPGLGRMVDPAVMAAARPFLTGDPSADDNIIGFYEAKAKLQPYLKQQQ